MSVTLERVAAVLAERLPIYRYRAPVYQTVMLQALERIWEPASRTVLDIGGGTGVIAQAVSELLPVTRVASVDVEDRYLPGLTVETATYDGARLPFADGAFDCAMFNNVIHHVPREVRTRLLAECHRATGGGPIYIKDHLAASLLDHARLAALDWIGNIPFGGMVRADYLEQAEWDALAAGAGYRIAETVSGPYRRGPMAAAFPNRLEISMKWLPLSRAAAEKAPGP